MERAHSTIYVYIILYDHMIQKLNYSSMFKRYFACEIWYLENTNKEEVLLRRINCVIVDCTILYGIT